MSKATAASDDDVQLPDDSDAFEVRRRLHGDFALRSHNSDNRFNATDEALPWGENLRGTDQQFVRQFIEAFNSSLIDSYDPIVCRKIFRSDRTGELRIRLKNTFTTVGYNRVQRSVAETDYIVNDVRVLSGGTVSLAFGHTNE